MSTIINLFIIRPNFENCENDNRAEVARLTVRDVIIQVDEQNQHKRNMSAKMKFNTRNIDGNISVVIAYAMSSGLL